MAKALALQRLHSLKFELALDVEPLELAPATQLTLLPAGLANGFFLELTLSVDYFPAHVLVITVELELSVPVNQPVEAVN